MPAGGSRPRDPADARPVGWQPGARAPDPRCPRSVRLRSYLRAQCRRSSPPRTRRSGSADHGSRRDRGLVERAWQVRVEGSATHRHVLAGQREVRRLRRGLRLLRPVALRRGRHADARDDDPGADPRARTRGRGGGRAPLLHGHAGPGTLQARLPERPRGRAAGGRAHQPEALRLDRPHVGRAGEGAQGGASNGSTTTSRRPRATTPRSPAPCATRAGCARSRRSRRPGSRPASAAS